MITRPEPSAIETEIIIIGAGPAGLTIAEALAKIGKDVWVLGSPYESQTAKAGPLRDVTKIPEGTNGLDHMENWINRLTDAGVNHRSSLCTGIEINDNLLVKTKYQNFLAQKIIIASGAKQMELGFKGEDDFLYKGISDCAVCDWGLFRGKNVAVVGNHKYTIRAVEFLQEQMPNVSLLWFNDSTEFISDKIHVYSNVEALEAKGDEVLQSVKFNSSSGEHEIPISALFVEGQPIPATSFLLDGQILIENGFVKVNDDYETNIANIWAVGDVTGKTASYDEAVESALKVIEQLHEL